ncbi:cytochrome-c peroxidase [Motiliproteus sp. SC1-56]|uniref:cytochrome-c peroxidase n=1 Tax=Motiliproteus sp. SC1-56 TaxID=2799565 RepID=UPI001A8C367C|nr:cytochrome c peroxidase [Motiliproteus sp. SC1-56]
MRCLTQSGPGLLAKVLLMLSLGLAARGALAAEPALVLSLNAEPARPVPTIVEVEPRKQALGRKIFFNPRLSKDQQTSCATCHALPPLKEGEELHQASELMGDHDRSVPLLYNVALAYWWNWDGQYRSLDDLLEASFPALDKMNLAWDQVILRLLAAYGDEFEAIYGGPPDQQRVVEVLGAFLKGLNAPNARFDRFLRGEVEALSPREREGYELFKEIGCASCHHGVMLGTNFFEEFYIYRHEGEEGVKARLKDLGRFYVTAEESDRNVFRVPSLRNVAQSAPYFHDGSADTLEGAVEEMIEHQLGLKPEPAQVQLLVDFLHTLTGSHPGVSP